jgi:hypothetical protein
VGRKRQQPPFQDRRKVLRRDTESDADSNCESDTITNTYADSFSDSKSYTVHRRHLDCY